MGGGGGEGWSKGDGGVGGGEGRGEGGGEGGGGGGVAQVMIEDQVSWGGGHWADEGAHQLFQSEFSQFFTIFPLQPFTVHMFTLIWSKTLTFDAKL